MSTKTKVKWKSNLLKKCYQVLMFIFMSASVRFIRSDKVNKFCLVLSVIVEYYFWFSTEHYGLQLQMKHNYPLPHGIDKDITVWWALFSRKVTFRIVQLARHNGLKMEKIMQWVISVSICTLSQSSLKVFFLTSLLCRQFLVTNIFGFLFKNVQISFAL